MYIYYYKNTVKNTCYQVVCSNKTYTFWTYQNSLKKKPTAIKFKQYLLPLIVLNKYPDK